MSGRVIYQTADFRLVHTDEDKIRIEKREGVPVSWTFFTQHEWTAICLAWLAADAKFGVPEEPGVYFFRVREPGHCEPWQTMRVTSVDGGYICGDGRSHGIDAGYDWYGPIVPLPDPPPEKASVPAVSLSNLGERLREIAMWMKSHFDESEMAGRYRADQIDAIAGELERCDS